MEEFKEHLVQIQTRDCNANPDGVLDVYLRRACKDAKEPDHYIANLSIVCLSTVFEVHSLGPRELRRLARELQDYAAEIECDRNNAPA